MKLIVGLGNPGEKYKNNRHNVGFMVVDKVVGNRSWEKSKGGNLYYFWLKNKQGKIELIKPLSYMNNSGQSVDYAYEKHSELRLEDLYVIHDDLDIRLGEYKIQRGKGPKLHYGISSIEDELRETGFWRVRIGVDNREPGPHFAKASRGEDYVLQDFTDEEKKVLDKVIFEICKKLATY